MIYICAVSNPSVTLCGDPMQIGWIVVIALFSNYSLAVQRLYMYSEICVKLSFYESMSNI